MKKFKRFLMSLLLTKQERVMIWNALWFSNHTYRRRGNVDGAAAVQMVMNRTAGLIVPKGRTYSEKEVSEIVDEVLKGAAKASEEILGEISRHEFRKGYRRGRAERTMEDIVEPLRPFPTEVDGEIQEGMEFDKEKCKTCEERDNCIVFAMIFGQDEEDTEKGAKDEEQAPEGTTAHHETPSEEAEKKEDEGK